MVDLNLNFVYKWYGTDWEIKLSAHKKLNNFKYFEIF